MTDILTKLTALCASTSSENTVTVNRSTLEEALSALAQAEDDQCLHSDFVKMKAERDELKAVIVNLETERERINILHEEEKPERDALLQKLDSYSYALEQVEQANEALRQASEGQRRITEAAIAWRDADGTNMKYEMLPAINALIAAIDAYRAEAEKGATDEQR